MKHSKTLALLSTIAVLAATPSFGQEHDQATREGAERMQNAERKAPTFIKAPIGIEALVNDEAGHLLGSMIDYVVDRESGELLFVALQLQEEVGQPRLIPFEKFAWNAETKHLSLPVTREFLQSMPVFDVEVLARTGELGTHTMDADAKLDEAGKAREAAMAKKLPRRLAASTLHGTHVLAKSERFGTVTELLIEPKHGRIAFVLVKNETTTTDPYILPWKVMSWELGESMKGRFVLPITTHQLTEAPTLKDGKAAMLSERELMHTIHGFFKQHAPEHHKKPAEHARG